MKHEHSYAELTKAYALANSQRKEKCVQSIYLDILIQESILKEKRLKIMEQIDVALDQNNQIAFFQLAKELNKIDKELNA